MDTNNNNYLRNLANTEKKEKFSKKFKHLPIVVKNNLDNSFPNISMAGWLSSPNSAKLGLMINKIINQSDRRGSNWNTLFSNSTLEALYAVIRITRQMSHNLGCISSKKVVIFDRELQYEYAFDPYQTGPQKSLCPYVYFCKSEGEFISQVLSQKDSLASVIVVLYPGQILSIEVELTMNALSVDSSAITVIANTEKRLSSEDFGYISCHPDIVIHGENLTDFEAPISTFSFHEDVYKRWASRKTLSSYTSTFAGNSVVLATAISSIFNSKIVEKNAFNECFKKIEDSFDERIKYFSKYVHPIFADLFLADRNDLRIKTARGAHLHLENGCTILDLSSLGCSLRGHNPDFDAKEPLLNYSETTDYFDLIDKRIQNLTKFDCTLPSVSGAGAVDNAITAAILANPGRRKIVTFVGNYSGKTLISVNFSKTAPLLADFDLPAFEPYYEDMIYINPWNKDAKADFLAAVSDNDVALVWFELLQGYMLRQLPQDLLDAVAQYKDACGYLIGVDEVLTGMWKNGKSILSHTDYIDCVDITTMSKATSDMVFPVSWALVTSEVYSKAARENCSALYSLRYKYRNNFGGMIALNAIDSASKHIKDDNDNLSKNLDFLERRLQVICQSSEIFSGFNRFGSLFKLNLNQDWFPGEGGSIKLTLFESTISKLILQITGVLLTNLRVFIPSLCDSNLINEILTKLESGLSRINPSTVYAYLLCTNYSAVEYLGIRDEILESINRTTNISDMHDNEILELEI